MKLSFEINNSPVTVEVADNMPLLWVIRDVLGMKGTKFGCGQAMCGACTVQIDGEAIRSCSYAAKFVAGKKVTTIEGLGTANELHPVQQAWKEAGVPQCGYCQPGFIMATKCLLEKNSTPTLEDIHDNITNVCRCGTYHRMRAAIQRAIELHPENIVKL